MKSVLINPENRYIKKLLICETSAIPVDLLNKIHELRSTYAVLVLNNVKCQDGFVVIKRGRKGSKAKIKYYMKYGTVRLN